MAKKLAQIMEKILRERRNKIEARAKELIAEQMTLRDLRKARELTQERMAELLKIRQDSVSGIAKRIDVLIFTYLKPQTPNATITTSTDILNPVTLVFQTIA